MPLVDMVCKKPWMPPEEPPMGDSAEEHAVFLISDLAPVQLPRVLTALQDDPPKPSDVRVNFLPMHRASFNAPEVEMIIQPGVGNDDFTGRELGRRRIAIRNAMSNEIIELYQQRPEERWPILDLEINIAGGFSGACILPDGTIRSSWD